MEILFGDEELVYDLTSIDMIGELVFSSEGHYIHCEDGYFPFSGHKDFIRNGNHISISSEDGTLNIPLDIFKSLVEIFKENILFTNK